LPEEIAMADVNLPLSGAVTQTFAPWAANYITVNVGNSTNPDTEKAVLAVASYGKQLGRIGDALLVLLRHLPADAKLSEHEKDAIGDLKTMLREIARVKEEYGGKHVLKPT
jgi:hypothetical protein